MDIPSNLFFVTGNIFDTQLDAIGHGVNLYGVMGSGIAKIIKDRHPNVFLPYKDACRSGVLTIGECLPVEVETGFWVLNLASQDKPGKNARLDWLEQSVEAGIDFVRKQNLKGLALPRIGAGVGGLQWDAVKNVLTRIAVRNPDVKIEVWSLENAE